MIVVADTSPLNYLVLVGQIEILSKIYAEVLIPQAVLDELQDSDAPAEVRASISAKDDSFVGVLTLGVLSVSAQ